MPNHLQISQVCFTGNYKFPLGGSIQPILRLKKSRYVKTGSVLQIVFREKCCFRCNAFVIVQTACSLRQRKLELKNPIVTVLKTEAIPGGATLFLGFSFMCSALIDFPKFLFRAKRSHWHDQASGVSWKASELRCF